MTDLHKTIEPVEPVAYVDLDFLKEESHAYAFVKRHNPWQTPLYTTPPSVDALIAEAVAKEREACAKVAESFYYYIRQYTTDVPDIEQAIRARGQK